jgi:hypothetical protein
MLYIIVALGSNKMTGLTYISRKWFVVTGANFELRPANLNPGRQMADSGGDPTLPSLRELELEQLLREREQQLLELTVEYTVAFSFVQMFNCAT